MLLSTFFGSSGKWSDRVVCVVSMLPDEEGKQLKQQVQRITTNNASRGQKTLRIKQAFCKGNNMIQLFR